MNMHEHIMALALEAVPLICVTATVQAVFTFDMLFHHGTNIYYNYINTSSMNVYRGDCFGCLNLAMPQVTGYVTYI